MLTSAIKALMPAAKAAATGAKAAAASGVEAAARLGQAAWIGALSVPRAWAASVPAVRPMAFPDTLETVEPPTYYVFGIA